VDLEAALATQVIGRHQEVWHNFRAGRFPWFWRRDVGVADRAPFGNWSGRSQQRTPKRTNSLPIKQFA